MATDKNFNIRDLSEQQQKDFTFVTRRIGELQDARKSHYGVNLNTLWADADRDYIPHRLRTKGKRIVAVDEDKGWRGALVNLGASDWQSDISQSNPYTKIQVALSILVDQNPTGIFTALAKAYQKTTILISQLYSRSWEFAKSKQQLKLFVFNLAKYGWAIGRTYPLRIVRKVKVLVEFNQENPEQSTYEEKEVIEFNDITRENLDPRNAWIDDMARPNDSYSLRDWAWRKVYPMDIAKEMFEKYPRWKAGYVKSGGNTQETIDAVSVPNAGKNFQEKELVEVYFYENLLKDLFMVIANGIPIIIEPLPISDEDGHKKLSCWQTYWTLRHAESPYGIGIYESIRYDQGLLDRLRNMTIDQLTLSIYKMFFYSGTQSLTETGDIKIAPGIGKPVLDPKNIKWLEVPPPGAEAWKGLEVFKKDLDDASGISDPLLGIVTGKTAFEIAQAKEAALKRLKTPLDNILDALNAEGYITVSLIQLLYSIPETYKIADPNLIDDYLKEIESDSDLYERDEEGNFVARVFREFPLNLDKDEKGNLTETKETRFFRIKPRFLKWDGIVNIKSQSILTPSKQLDKTLELEMWNMLIPLFAQPPELYKKSAENIAKLYDKDPKDILPDSWLVEETPEEQPLFVSADQQAQQGIPPQIQQGTPQAQRLVSQQSIAPPQQNATSLGQRIISRLSSPFRKV